MAIYKHRLQPTQSLDRDVTQLREPMTINEKSEKKEGRCGVDNHNLTSHLHYDFSQMQPFESKLLRLCL